MLGCTTSNNRESTSAIYEHDAEYIFVEPMVSFTVISKSFSLACSALHGADHIFRLRLESGVGRSTFPSHCSIA